MYNPRKRRAFPISNGMNKPLVSIVIPAYNASDYVREAVDSALNQTYKPIEVIVVDDGSTDGTSRILESYSKSGKIIYIRQGNKGLAGARNAGIKVAKGSYIALLDADDIFLRERISKQVAALEANSGFGVCYCDLLHFLDGPRRVFYHHRYPHPSGGILEPLLHRQFINPLTVMARKTVFEKYGYFDENLRRSEDWDLWLRWAHRGVKFYYLDKILAHYRMRNVGNLSSIESEPLMKLKNLEVFARLGNELSETEKNRYQFKGILERLRFKTAVAYLMVGDKKESTKYLGDSRLRFFVKILPSFFWRVVLSAFRVLKHRLLLQKL